MAVRKAPPLFLRRWTSYKQEAVVVSAQPCYLNFTQDNAIDIKEDSSKITLLKDKYQGLKLYSSLTTCRVAVKVPSSKTHFFLQFLDCFFLSKAHIFLGHF